jgi:hypothetical protein
MVFLLVLLFSCSKVSLVLALFSFDKKARFKNKGKNDYVPGGDNARYS